MEYKRGKFFRDVHLWPIANELDYDGWLNNFTNKEDREIAEKILDFFCYYPSMMVDQMLNTSVGRAGSLLQPFFPEWSHDYFKTKCIYSYIPGEIPNPTDSGYLFLRKLRNELNIPEDRILDYSQLSDCLSQQKENVPVIFVDDIVGSGEQCRVAWNETNCGANCKTLHDISNETSHKFVYAPLIINQKGYDTIIEHCPQLLLSPSHIIDDEYNLFSEKCICWNNSKEEYYKGIDMINRISNDIGIIDDDSIISTKGYKGQGLAVAFAHGAPDAIPAFFYWNANGWAPLIKKVYDR